MLRPVICLAAGLFLLWVSLSSGLTAVARSQSPGDDGMAHYGFGVCDLPCWAGITPGETAMADMPALLENNVPAFKSLRVYEGGSIYFEMGQTTSGIQHNQGKFYAINLSLPDASLFYLMTQLNRPDCVEVLPGAGMYLIWDKAGFSIATILWGSPADALHDEAAQTQNVDIFALSGCTIPTRLPWRGFAPLWFYERLAQERQS